MRDPRKSKRPKLCAVCHSSATHVEEEDVMVSHINRDAIVQRYWSVRSTFYCAEHTGMSQR